MPPRFSREKKAKVFANFGKLRFEFSKRVKSVTQMSSAGMAGAGMEDDRWFPLR
jgi:hypothetical protein